MIAEPSFVGGLKNICIRNDTLDENVPTRKGLFYSKIDRIGSQNIASRLFGHFLPVTIPFFHVPPDLLGYTLGNRPVNEGLSAFMVKNLTHGKRVVRFRPEGWFGNAEGRSLASVLHLDAKTIAGGFELNANPSPLIQMKLLYGVSEDFVSLATSEASFFYRKFGCNCSRYHLFQLHKNEDGIDDNGSECQRSHKPSKTSVIALISCVFFIVMNLYAARQIVENSHCWGWALLFICGPLGLAYCFRLFVQSTL